MTNFYSDFRFSRFLAAFLLLFSAVVVQLKAAGGAGFRPALVLAVLIAFALFLDTLELLFLSLLAALFLNWQPALSFELLVLVLFPLLVGLGRRLLPAIWWLNLIIVSFGGFLALYLLSDFSFLFDHGTVFLLDLALGMTVGLIALYLMKYFSHGHAT